MLKNQFEIDKRLYISLLFVWFLATTYVYAFKRLAVLGYFWGVSNYEKIKKWVFNKQPVIKKYHKALTNYLLATAERIINSIINIFSARTSKKVKKKRFTGYVKRIVSQISFAQKRLASKATGDLFEFLERNSPDKFMLQYFIAKCRDEFENVQLIASTAAMAIKVSEESVALELLRIAINRFPTEVSVHQQIGVKAFILGRYALAEEIWTQCNVNREAIIVKRGLDKLKIRFLAPSWFFAIGHIAHLDIYFKHKIMSGRENHRTFAILPSGWKMPNDCLMKLWDGFLSSVDYEIIKQLSIDDITLLQDEFWTITFEDGRSKMFNIAGAIVQQRWQDQGRKPLLKFEMEETKEAREQLEKMGVPKNAWFVALHVREPGFHKQWHKSHPGTRNADIETYLLAARAIVAAGGYVIRLGDKTMKPLPNEKGILDYALSENKTPFLDIFIVGTCRFFIGTNSGLGLVPPLFGIKCALTNWSPIAIPQWYPEDKFIPKLIKDIKTGQILTFEEMLKSPAGWEQFQTYFDKNDLQVIDNEPQEILELIEEFLKENLNSEKVKNDSSGKEEKFRLMMIKYVGYEGSKIGRSFLGKYNYLIQ